MGEATKKLEESTEVKISIESWTPEAQARIATALLFQIYSRGLKCMSILRTSKDSKQMDEIGASYLGLCSMACTTVDSTANPDTDIPYSYDVQKLAKEDEAYKLPVYVSGVMARSLAVSRQSIDERKMKQTLMMIIQFNDELGVLLNSLK